MLDRVRFHASLPGILLCKSVHQCCSDSDAQEQCRGKLKEKESVKVRITPAALQEIRITQMHAGTERMGSVVTGPPRYNTP